MTIGLTEHRDLRGGQPSWIEDDLATLPTDPLPRSADIAIVGAGVVGAMLADRLAAPGRRVVLLDRRPPARGSTAASTALVMWAADVPLSHLAQRIGEDEAARRWRRVYRAMRDLAARIDDEGIECARVDRPELYLAGSLLDEGALAAEGEMRRRHDLPSDLLDAGQVAARFDIDPRAALVSQGCYEVDPVALTIGLLARARDRGAVLHYPCDVVVIEQEDGLALRLADGARIECGQVILASGYERAALFLPAAFSVGSSYAIATPPGVASLWRENAMIWEASSPYLYARATANGRVIAGGEDEDFADPDRRDALIERKAGTIAGKLGAMLAERDVTVECRWAANFGSSPDGLPAIGRAAHAHNVWLAAAFGGNGVSFAALAADLITAEIDGRPDPDAKCFDPYRFD